MCGIIGMYCSEGINNDSFKYLVSNLSHRGPDFQDSFFDENIALGHTRLSIIDLDKTANQPLISSDRNYIIVFNGEIYNYLELRQTLEKAGFYFKTKSDTEVLLSGFIHYGEKILEKLNGIFSFCIYNKNEKSLFLARDISGIKPLYYYFDKEKFIFSSEIKVLKKYSSGLNQNSQIKFYVYGSIPGEETIYNGILNFPKGSYAFFNQKKLTLKKFSSKLKIFSLKKSIEESVRLEMVSDAPLGVFLSGGLDSSIIASIASKFNKQLNTFSLVYNSEDEKFQKLMSNRLQSNHFSKHINQNNFIEEKDSFIDSIDQPTIDGFNVYLLSKFLSENSFKVGISGIGADELFYGYPSFKRVKFLKFLSDIGIQTFSNFLPDSYKKIEYLKFDHFFSLYLANRAIFTPSYISQKFGISLNDFFDLIYPSLENEFQQFKMMSEFETNYYMETQLLRDADVFGMKNSVEIRVPFLNELVKNSLVKGNIQAALGKNNKQTLVDLFKNDLPLKLYSQKKRGFELPYDYWLRNNINTLNIDSDLKKSFLDRKLHWSKIWLDNIYNTKFS